MLICQPAAPYEENGVLDYRADDAPQCSGQMFLVKRIPPLLVFAG